LAIELLDVIIRVGLVLATTILFAIVSIAYFRVRNRKLLWITAGFGVFFVHAWITIPELFISLNFELSENAHLLIHSIALILILIGTLKD
jgi:hypothetical protein